MLDILRYRLRGAENRFRPVEELAEGGRRAAADNTVLGTAAAGKDRGDGIIRPSLKRCVAGQVTVPDDRAHDIGVVADHNVAEGIRDMSKWILPNSAFVIPPDQVRHRFRFFIIFHAVHQLAQGLFGGVASEHIVYLRVFHLFLKEIGR